jgi:hypothetical protein
MIPLSKTDYERVRAQIDHVLINIRNDLVRNATEWKGRAEGGEMEISLLATRMTRAFDSKIVTLNNILNVQSEDWTEIQKLFRIRGATADTEVRDTATAFLSLFTKVNGMPKANVRHLVDICDLIIAEVVPPISGIWEE